MFVLMIIHGIVGFLLMIYAVNSWVLTILYLKHRRNARQSIPPLQEAKMVSGEELPPVTVQLPIFNEALVTERLIDTIVRLDYPADRLHIQVLDDSTDETTAIALACVEHYRRQGFNIELIRRSDRAGFKAGSLRNGLEKATGEFIAIFDADFVPEPDFLKQTVPYLMANPHLVFVQTRWEHINRDYSSLTAAQAIARDGHFVVEHIARNRSGLFINFNGTAGVWRRECIEAAGDWQDDTLFEDFDLSYRAQLAGWAGLYLPDVIAPAELPPQLAAYKRQQFRWAKGTTQCLKKLGWAVLRTSLAWPVKFQALLHLSSYLVHPLMLILAVISPILLMAGGTAGLPLPMMVLPLVSLGSPFLYIVAQAALYPTTWWQRYKAMLTLALLGSGLALSNTKAIGEALLGVGNVFWRTPKFNVTAATDQWQSSLYRLPLDGLVWGELALSLYLCYGAWIAATNGYPFSAPLLLLYALGCGYVSLQGLWEARLRFVAQKQINRIKQDLAIAQ